MKRKQKESKKRGCFILFFFFIQNASAAPPLYITGSSTVFPFAATVAEHFHYKTNASMPLVEGIGTGPGIKLFCASRLKGPDGVIASRPFTQGEIEKCKSQGVTFEEFKIGQDGLVFIQNKGEASLSLTLATLNDALAEKVPQGTDCVTNPYKTWKAIQGNLPPFPIRVLGPAPTSGTYDVLIEKMKDTCGPHLRHDGAYIEAPTNENLIIQKVLNTPATIGIITFSFYDQNRSRLQPISLNGMMPTFESIQDGKYPLGRALYLYIKTNDLKHFPDRVNYTLEFTSTAAIGEAGYLTKKGLIPLSPVEQNLMHKRAAALQQREIP